MEGKKHDEGRPRLDLLPFDALIAIGKVMKFGAEKYTDRNWEHGMPWGKLLRASLSHLFLWAGGEENDPESKEPHLAHAGASVLMLLALVLRNMGRDTRRNPTESDGNPAPAPTPEAAPEPPVKMNLGVSPQFFDALDGLRKNGCSSTAEHRHFIGNIEVPCPGPAVLPHFEACRCSFCETARKHREAMEAVLAGPREIVRAGAPRGPELNAKLREAANGPKP